MKSGWRTYDGPSGTLERDDEGRGPAGLVAFITEAEVGVILGDEEARDQYPANVK